MYAISIANVEMAVGVIVAIMAVIATCWGGVKAIREALAPLTHLIKQSETNTRSIVLLQKNVETIEKKLEDHTSFLNRDRKALECDQERLDDLEKSNRLVLRGISQIIEHELSGNHTDELRKTRNDIDEYLINR